MNYNVPDTLLNDILKYLGSRPYVEVFTLVQGIHKLAEQAAPVVPVAVPEAAPVVEQQSN